jgi:hypothetical protein
MTPYASSSEYLHICIRILDTEFVSSMWMCIDADSANPTTDCSGIAWTARRRSARASVRIRTGAPSMRLSSLPHAQTKRDRERTGGERPGRRSGVLPKHSLPQPRPFSLPPSRPFALPPPRPFSPPPSRPFSLPPPRPFSPSAPTILPPSAPTILSPSRWGFDTTHVGLGDVQILSSSRLKNSEKVCDSLQKLRKGV